MQSSDNDSQEQWNLYEYGKLRILITEVSGFRLRDLRGECQDFL